MHVTEILPISASFPSYPSLSQLLSHSEGKYHEQIRIADDATGYSYEVLFRPYVTEGVTEVWVEDPYIRHIHQVIYLYTIKHINQMIYCRKVLLPLGVLLLQKLVCLLV